MQTSNGDDGCLGGLLGNLDAIIGVGLDMVESGACFTNDGETSIVKLDSMNLGLASFFKMLLSKIIILLVSTKSKI
jgi:hypothetical protein